MKNMSKNKKSKITYLIFVIIIAIAALGYEFFTGEDTQPDYEGELNGNTINVHFLDVGQGDAAFIELPNSKTMLIDAGERGYGEGIVDYLNALDCRKIDYLVATHPHSDHIGSMSYVVENMAIGNVYMPKVSSNTKTFENLLEAISDKNLRVKPAAADTYILNEDNLSIKIVAPAEIDEEDLNNCSAVIKISYGDTSFLFTADAEIKELEQISDDISADVLKVGHHGSVTSTTEAFLADVNPEIAVISCGEGNDYGHPHDETMELLNDINADIYRTDRDKTVVVSSDGENLKVRKNVESIDRSN